jgi:hypothetical protein
MSLSEKLLEEDSDFLFAIDRQNLRSFLEEGIYNFEYGEEPEFIDNYVQGMKNEGIPPIFKEEFETELLRYNNGVLERFPNLVYIISHGSGTRENEVEKRRERDNNNHRKAEEWSKIGRVTPEQIKLFAERAFDDGEINPNFLRNLYHTVRISNAKDIKIDDYQFNNGYALRFLHEQLNDANLIPNITPYSRSFSGIFMGDISFVQENRMWHLDFSPEDRLKIASVYAKGVNRGVSNGGLPRNKKLMDKMRLIFPEVQILDEDGFYEFDTRKRYDLWNTERHKPREDRKRLHIPDVVMNDPLFQDLREDFVSTFTSDADIVRESNPSIFLETFDSKLAKALGVGKLVLQDPELREVVYQHKLEIFRGLSDDDFFSIIPNFASAMTRGVIDRGHTPSGMELHNYLMRRAKSMNPHPSRVAPYSQLFTHIMNPYIRERDYRTCQNNECGVTMKEKDKNFPVHHIDHDKSNDSEYNLLLLCQSCHSSETFSIEESRINWTIMCNDRIDEIYEELSHERISELLDLRGNLEERHQHKLGLERSLIV